MPPSHVVEKWIIAHVFAILTATTWIWGGWRFTWMPPVVWASASLSVLTLLSPWLMGERRVASSTRIWWLHDAFFFFGLLFLGYVGVQWYNSGRSPIYDPVTLRWGYSLPRHSGWPSAIDSSEAAQMLQWFFPAWALAMAMRIPALSRHAVMRLLISISYGSGLLALLGLTMYLSGSHKMYWVVPVKDHFFASFAYQNHAAAFFVLIGGLVAGLLYHEVFRTDRPRKRSRIVLLSATLVLCLTGANLALSRAGIILAWSLFLSVSAYGLARGWRVLSAVRRVRLATVTVAISCILYFAVAGFGSKDIRREFAVRPPAVHTLFPTLDKVGLSLGDRPLLDRIAWDMWKDAPLFGVGGWGFRHLLAHHVDRANWAWVRKPGQANVHCDPLQFLLEFGGVGAAFIAAALGALLMPLWRRWSRCGTLMLPLSLGILLVVVFSLIDLPFRCPAILYTWVVLLAALPKIAGVRSPELE